MKMPKLNKDDLHKLVKYATKVPSKAAEIKHKVRERTAAAVTAAFAFVIALIWRDLIRASVDEIMKKMGIEGTGYVFMAISALFVTAICVIGIMFFSKWGEK